MTTIDDGVDLIEAKLDDYEVVGDRPRMTWKQVQNIYGRPLWSTTKVAARWTAIIMAKASKLALRASKYTPDLVMAILLATMVQTFINMDREVRGAEEWIGTASAALVAIGLLAGLFWSAGLIERRIQANSPGRSVPIAQSTIAATMILTVVGGVIVFFTYNLAEYYPAVVGRFFAAVLAVTIAALYLNARRRFVARYRQFKGRRATSPQPA